MQLFFFDGAGPSTIPEDVANPIQTGTGEENASANIGSFNLPSKEKKSGINSFLTSNHRKAAWVDPDDINIQVSLSSDKRLRKLRDTIEDDTIGGKDYEARLRRQYGFSCTHRSRY